MQVQGSILKVDFPPNLEGDVDRIKLDLGLLHLDPHLRLEVSRRNSLQLAGSVCRKTSSLRPIMQHQSLR